MVSPRAASALKIPLHLKIVSCANPGHQLRRMENIVRSIFFGSCIARQHELFRLQCGSSLLKNICTGAGANTCLVESLLTYYSALDCSTINACAKKQRQEATPRGHEATHEPLGAKRNTKLPCCPPVLGSRTKVHRVPNDGDCFFSSIKAAVEAGNVTDATATGLTVAQMREWVAEETGEEQLAFYTLQAKANPQERW